MKHVVLLVVLSFLLSACAIVDVTKTGKGYYEPTNPNDVEILMTKPDDRPYIELGSITVAKFDVSQMAKLHNALRTKSAPLGADAVILLDQGVNDDDELWATGVCVRWKENQ